MRDEDDMADEYDFSEYEGKENPYAQYPYDDIEESEISSWNYRLIRGEDGLMTIGEVYYNSKEEPIAWMVEAAIPESDHVEEIISELKLMLDAAQKPVFQIPNDGEGDKDDTTRN